MNWESFVYQYAVGGIIFLAGLVIAWRSGDYSWKNWQDRLSTFFVVAIFVFYFSGHLVWQILASGGG